MRPLAGHRPDAGDGTDRGSLKRPEPLWLRADGQHLPGALGMRNLVNRVDYPGGTDAAGERVGRNGIDPHAYVPELARQVVS